MPTLSSRLLTFIESIPTTVCQFILSAAAFVATVVAVLAFNAKPADSYYLFVTGWSTLSVGQYIGKRMTFQPPTTPS